MLECNHMPTQRANIVLFIQWRMQGNRGVVRQNNSETRGVRVRDEEKISANPRSWYEAFSLQPLAADVRWSMRLEEQSPPLKAPPPQAPLHYRPIHYAGQKSQSRTKNNIYFFRLLWPVSRSLFLGCLMLHICSS